MENLNGFLLKASAGIAVFYLVYWLSLRKETFFKANRVFLLGGLLLAVLLPLFPFHYAVLQKGGVQLLQSVINLSKPAIIPQPEKTIPRNSFSWDETITLVYLTGAAMFLLRLLYQSMTILYLAIKFKVKETDGVKIVENDKYGLPFSFFNLVFINPKFHTQANLPEILAHEKVHIREFHWADLLITELLTVVFWFNPFIWLVEHAIKQNHEYLADSGVISRGHSIGGYQALLLNQLMGMQIVGVTNNLNFALNAKRFKMMTKKKTPKIKAVKFCWVLPALALLLFAFAEPDYKTELKANKSSIGETGNLPVEKGYTISGVVTDENGEALPGASIVVKGTKFGTVSDNNGNFKLEIPESNDATLVFSFVGLKTTSIKIKAGESKANKGLRIQMKKDIIGISGVVIANYKDEKGKGRPLPPPNPGQLTMVESLPAYPGGSEALEKFVQEMEQKYAREKNLKGKATVNFTVGSDGKVKDINVVKSDSEEIAKASRSIVSQIKDWKPGSQQGKNVPAYYGISIEF